MKKLYCGFLLLSSSSFLSFSQNPGDATFFSPDIHTIKMYFSQANWYDSLVYYKPLDKKMLGNVEIDGTYIDSVGIQFKGNSSYNAPGIKKPFKIDFNEFVSGQKYDGLKTLNLNNAMKDPSFMREKLFDDFCRTAGIAAPRATYANVYVNDTLWGFYTLVEQVNTTFLNTHFGNKDGNLFKGDANGTLEWYGTSQFSYNGKYELKTNETVNNWTDLIRLIDEINNTPSSNFYDSLEIVFNTQAWINGWAANNIFVNLDSYLGTGHNYYIYHNTSSNKFDFIIWDANEAFGNFNQGMTVVQLEAMSLTYIPSSTNKRPLTDKMIQNTTYKNIYVNTVCNYVNNYFNHSYFDAKIDSLANRIRSYVNADPNKPYNNQAFEDNINMTVMNNIPGLKSFITNRGNSLKTQLAAYGCSVGQDENSTADAGMVIFPNPCNATVSLQLPIDNGELKIIDVLGKIVYQEIMNGKQKTVNINLENGIYSLQIIAPEFSVTKKLVVAK